MKEVKKNLAALIGSLDQEIENRENYFSEKSENWQESEKGEDYQSKTETLENLRDECNNAMDELFPED